MHTIEYDSVNDVLYGILIEDTPWRLCTIDVNTGAIATVAAVSQNGLTGSAFDPTAGTMYVSNIYSHELLTIDLGNGQLTEVGSFNAGIQVGTGMAFHPSYGLLATDNKSNEALDDELYQIDTSTGAATLIGAITEAPPDYENILALAYVPEPSTFLLLSIATLVFSACHRREHR